jgi:hypothetical protein
MCSAGLLYAASETVQLSFLENVSRRLTEVGVVVSDPTWTEESKSSKGLGQSSAGQAGSSLANTCTNVANSHVSLVDAHTNRAYGGVSCMDAGTHFVNEDASHLNAGMGVADRHTRLAQSLII